jgi:hypothetical protein
MALELNGTTGVSLVQDGVIATADLADGAVTAAKIGSLPAGSVLQVVEGSTTTVASYGNTTYVTTNLSASITPTSASSKILVIVSQTISFKTDTTSERIMYVRLLRGATELVEMPYDFTTADNTSQAKIPVPVSINYVDSPSTTSSVTYSTEFKLNDQQSDIFAQNNNRKSNIILMEIAQ